MNLDERVGKRHITELRRIRLEVQEKGDSSDDESFIQELMSERDRKMSRLKSLQEWQQSSHVSRQNNLNSSAATQNHNRLSRENEQLPEPPPLESTSASAGNNSNEHLDQSGEAEDMSEMEPASLPDLPALEEITKPLHSANNMITLEERQPNEPESNFFSLLRYFFCQVENQGIFFKILDALGLKLKI